VRLSATECDCEHAYRRRCAEPVNTKVQYKAATRDLCVVEEAEILANEIEGSSVQVRTDCD
jgi:hypothetical protein